MRKSSLDDHFIVKVSWVSCDFAYFMAKIKTVFTFNSTCIKTQPTATTGTQTPVCLGDVCQHITQRTAHWTPAPCHRPHAQLSSEEGSWGRLWTGGWVGCQVHHWGWPLMSNADRSWHGALFISSKQSLCWVKSN